MAVTGCSLATLVDDPLRAAGRPRSTGTAVTAPGHPPHDPTDLVTLAEGERGWLGRTYDTVAADYVNFYSGPRMLGLGVAIGLAGISANSQLDRDIYEDLIPSWRTDDSLRIGTSVTTMGEGLYAIPAFGVTALAGNALGLPGVGLWGERSLRAVVVGAPPLLFLQHAIGAGRPDDPANNDSSEWVFFQHANGVSGHAFIGAVSWLTAARMVENDYASLALGVGSLLVPAARLQGNRHYFSQVALGWFLAYLSTGAIADADAARATTVLPMVEEGTVGLLVEHRF